MRYRRLGVATLERRGIRSSVGGALLVALAQLSFPAFLRADPMNIDVPAQPLSTALREFARQTGIQVATQSELTQGKNAPSVAGELEPHQALDALLDGTGLVAYPVNDHTYGIRAPQSAEGAVAGTAKDAARSDDAAEKGGKTNSFWDRFRLAQVDQGQAPVNSGEDPQSSEDEKGSSADGVSRSRPHVEEVIVTAQKREERPFDVPISIVALGAEELQRRKITDIDDLSLAVPGLVVQSTGSYSRLITLRGVSNAAGNSSLVGLYLDEASVTGTPFEQLDLRTYDLDRVEVLRGPQGTLYGEGSVGGTIRFITRNPQLDRFGGNADLSASFTQDGDPGQRFEGAINIPLLENELGLRLAGTFDREGGWVDQPAAGKKDINDQDLINVRAKGLWRPTQKFAANVMAVVHRNDAPPNSGEDSSGNYTQTFNLTTTPDVQDDYELYNVTLSYDAAAVRTISTASYANHDKEISNLGSRRQFTPPGTPPFDTYQPSLSRTSHVFTKELRFSSNGAGRLKWTAGAFYRDAQAEVHVPQFFFDLAGPPGTPLPAPFPPFQTINQFKSWALFGEANYEVTNRLTLGTGVRYFEDDQEDRSGPITMKARFNATNPRFYAQFKLSDEVNAYVSAAKGFRSGGFNLLDEPTFAPESVWTHELGAKVSTADGSLGSEIALFYSEYTDYQIFGVLLNPPLNVTSNAGDARIKGVEWAFNWSPTQAWSLGLSGNYVKSEFHRINATSTSHIVGDPLDFFPKYAYTASAQRDLTLGGRPSFIRLDYGEHGRMTFRNRSFGPWYFSESDVINMLNFAVDVQWNDSVSLTLFGRNLLDEDGYSDPTSIEEQASRPRPRSYGIGVRVIF